MTTPTGPAASARPACSARREVSQLKVLRSEWTKLRTLPSTAWSLLAAVALIVGFGTVYALVRVTRPPHQPADLATFDPTSVSLTGVYLAQLAIGVLGVLLVTGEYATGTIRGSLAAVPRRLPLLWGKAITVAVTTLVLCVPAAAVAFLVGQSILSAEHLDTTLGHPGVARAVLGAGLYLAAVGLLGVGLGALFRNTAAAISALFGLLFAPQILAGLLPGSWSDTISAYLPSPAGMAVTAVRPDPSSLGPWSGLAVFCLYAAAALGLAARRLHRRDV
jgi:ABC-type transport system involved in multi-copper enzyme maturation permease subunit